MAKGFKSYNSDHYSRDLGNDKAFERDASLLKPPRAARGVAKDSPSEKDFSGNNTASWPTQWSKYLSGSPESDGDPKEQG
jgi:hypothetical protein